MRAARLFAERLANDGTLERTARVQVSLYGSLDATGKGHGTDKAVLLGLAGCEPDTVDIDTVPALLAAIRGSRRLHLLGRHPVDFAEREDLKFHRRATRPVHANGMRFVAGASETGVVDFLLTAATIGILYEETARGGLAVNIVDC